MLGMEQWKQRNVSTKVFISEQHDKRESESEREIEREGIDRKRQRKGWRRERWRDIVLKT